MRCLCWGKYLGGAVIFRVCAAERAGEFEPLGGGERGDSVGPPAGLSVGRLREEGDASADAISSLRF